MTSEGNPNEGNQFLYAFAEALTKFLNAAAASCVDKCVEGITDDCRRKYHRGKRFRECVDANREQCVKYCDCMVENIMESKYDASCEEPKV